MHVAEIGLPARVRHGDHDVGAGEAEPSFVLFRQLPDRKADALAAPPLASPAAGARDLEDGAVVTLTPRHLRARPLPFRRVT